MPLLEIKSLLKLDFFSRLKWLKRLFGEKTAERRLVCSDSTMERVLRWLSPKEASRFLCSFFEDFRREGADLNQLYPGGRKRRIVVGDGSEMGRYQVNAFALCGTRITYPFMIEGSGGRGKELSKAACMIGRIPEILGEKHKPDLLLYDYLGFNSSIFDAARQAGMHILVKGGESDFRDVLKDARGLFDSHHDEGLSRSSGFDLNRLWNWTIEETSDTFAGYPVRVARLVEENIKNPGEKSLSWIVTTDFSLSPAELVEAAHVRWSIENEVFKKLSGLVKTKRFHFKEQRPFLSLLRIICGALAAYDLTLIMMREDKSQIKGFLGPLKWTYGIVYNLLFFSLEEGCFS
jgi:hypothetical protein